MYKNCFECQNQKQFLYTTSSQFVFFLYWSRKSMNNLSSYCGLTNSRMSSSDTDLPVQKEEEKMCNRKVKGYQNLLINVAKMEQSGHYPVNDYSKEGKDRNWNSCNCFHWALDSSMLQNFPHEQCEEIGQGYSHCKHIPVVYVFHIGRLWDSIKAALNKCIKAKLSSQN